MMSKAIYTVWVGGVEVNEDYITKSEAEKLAAVYKADGYEDVYYEAHKREAA